MWRTGGREGCDETAWGRVVAEEKEVDRGTRVRKGKRGRLGEGGDWGRGAQQRERGWEKKGRGGGKGEQKEGVRREGRDVRGLLRSKRVAPEDIYSTFTACNCI